MATQKLNFNSISGSCSNLTSLATSLDGTISTIQSSVGKIKTPAWEGKAASNFRTNINKLLENLPDAEKQLAMSVIFLANSSDGYKALGNDAVNKIKDLIGGQQYIDDYDTSSLTDVLSYYDMSKITETNPPKTETPKTEDPKTDTPRTYTPRTYTPSPKSPVYTTVLDTGATTIGTVTGLVTTALAGQTIEIPSTVEQGGYTVTGYDYWINSGKPMTWASGTNQEKVSEIWKKQGSRFKNGIAVITVDGEDRYLIAVTTKFGKVGDCVDVTMADGKVVKCIIGDSKGSDAGSEWGHQLGGGKINVLEFEVQRSKFKESGNPTTAKWGLDWNSDRPVKSITNKGSIIGATLTDSTVTLASTNENSTNTATVSV